MSNFWQPKTLESENVLLQPLDNEHYTLLFEAASDPLIWEQHPAWNRYQEPVFKQYFQEALAGQMAFVIIDAATNQIIGCTRYYNFLEAESSVAIGYTFLTRTRWGGTYNKECKALLINHAFEKVATIVFHVGTQNFRSQKAIEKLGASLQGPELFENNGQMLPHLVYHLNQQNWKKNTPTV